MKKIAAFFTAAALFLVVIIILHFAFAGSLTTNNYKFGTWINSYKDSSYKAISSNIHDDTVMFMGSSEFHHGKKTPYHPSWVFRKQGMDVMCIGAAYNQSLTHAITLAAAAPLMHNRKVVLMVSPQWFDSEGATPEGFSVRFSESEYMRMLQNKNLSDRTKKCIAARTETLLKNDPSMQNRVIRYNRLFLAKHASFMDRMLYRLRRVFLNEQGTMTVNMAWKASGNKSYDAYVQPKQPVSPPDWKALAASAQTEYSKSSTNKFSMSDKFYIRHIRASLKSKKKAYSSKTYERSPEYNDLKLFLDVCHENGIKTELVILPMNGYWYDYCGFPAAKRKVCAEKVTEIGEEYGVSVCDLTGYSYYRGFFEDAMHPAAKGWVIIDEEVYRFFNQGQNFHERRVS